MMLGIKKVALWSQQRELYFCSFLSSRFYRYICA